MVMQLLPQPLGSLKEHVHLLDWRQVQNWTNSQCMMGLDSGLLDGIALLQAAMPKGSSMLKGLRKRARQVHPIVSRSCTRTTPLNIFHKGGNRSFTAKGESPWCQLRARRKHKTFAACLEPEACERFNFSHLRKHRTSWASASVAAASPASSTKETRRLELSGPS